METDAQLLAAWQRGDRAAGEALFERYYGVLVRFFSNKVGDDPMDLMHDTLLGCLAGHERLREHESFRSFLFAIAYNQLRSHFKRQRLRGQRFDPAVQTAADLSPGPGTMLVKSVEQRLLVDSLRHIPLEHQIVLELFYWEGMTSAEIAEILGEPHGTIRTRLRRARQLLEKAMEQLADSPSVFADTHSDIDGWAQKIRSALLHQTG